MSKKTNKKKKSTYTKYLELTKEELALRLIFAEDKIEKLEKTKEEPELLLEKKKM